MKQQLSTRNCLLLCNVIFILCFFFSSHVAAQIPLYEATDVTQTQATLSAAFPHHGEQHGFQYKRGTLPEIDALSHFVLSAESDPVQFTQGDKPWSIRTARGWIESYYDTNIPQLNSTIETNVTLTEDTEISFEWKVVSEANVGVLSFKIDGQYTDLHITGETEFEKVFCLVSAGAHTLTWEYQRTRTENSDYGIGYLRNIDIQNTTPGAWNSVEATGDSRRITSLWPASDYLFRAWSESDGYSAIGQLRTKTITVGSPIVVDTTQTTATITAALDAGDADVKAGCIVNYGNLVVPDAFSNTLLTDDSSPVNFNNLGFSRADGYVYADHNGISSYTYVGADVTFQQTSVVSFDWSSEGSGAEMGFYVYEGVNPVIVEYIKNYNSEHKDITIPAGTYSLRWKAVETGCKGRFTISNVKIRNTGNVRELQNDTIVGVTDGELLTCRIEHLLPSRTYRFKTFVQLADENDWPIQTGNDNYFTTKNILLSMLPVTEVTQTKATISAALVAGDATMTVLGLQYRKSDADSWKDVGIVSVDGDSIITAHISHLRSATTYECRAYVQATGCDTLFCENLSFTTAAVELPQPVIVVNKPHSAVIQHTVKPGDADIYSRGWQWRKYGENEWKTQEDVGSEEMFMGNLNSLELNVWYQTRTFARPMGQDTIFSNPLEFRPRDIRLYIDSITAVHQRSAVVHGRICPDDDVATDRMLIVNQRAIPLPASDTTFTVTVDDLYPNSNYQFSLSAQNSLHQVITDTHTAYKDLLLSDSIRKEVPSIDFLTYLFKSVDNVDSVMVRHKGGWRSYVFGGRSVRNDDVEEDNYLRMYVCGKQTISYEWYTSSAKIDDKYRATAEIELYLDGRKVANHHYTSPFDNHQFSIFVLDNKVHSIEWRAKKADTPNIPEDANCYVGISNLSASGQGTQLMSHFCPAPTVRTPSYFKSVNTENVTQTSIDIVCELEDTPDAVDKYGIYISDYRHPRDTVYGTVSSGILQAHIDRLLPGHNYEIQAFALVDGKEYRFYSKYSDYGNIYTLPVLVTAEIDSISQTSTWGRVVSVDAGTADIRNLRYPHYDRQADSIVYLPLFLGSQVFMNGLRNHAPLLYDIYDQSGEAAVMQSLIDGDTISYDITHLLKPISFTILPATNVSRTSATLNAVIGCDTYSGSKFGFVWGMGDDNGIRGDVHITYGTLQSDGVISVDLPSEELLPDTTYCYIPFVEHGRNNYTRPDYGENWCGYFKTLDPDLDRISVVNGSAGMRLGTSDGRITLQGVQDMIVKIADMQGRMVWNGRCRQQRQEIAVASGIYIVCIGNKYRIKVRAY